MKPFLLLSIRADDPAADNEYESFVCLAGLGEGDLRRVRLDQRPLGDIDLRGLVRDLGRRRPVQLHRPGREEVRRAAPGRGRPEPPAGRRGRADFPFLGACFGVGALGSHQGAVLDRRYGEPVGIVRVTLTAAGRGDPLLRELPEEFDAFTGHKEAVSELPGHAVLLASSAACPVQAFRLGANVYATQFHPELDAAGMCTRVDVYKHAGYFDPSEAEEIKAQAWNSEISHPPAILRAFVRRYGRDRVGWPEAAATG